MYVCFLLGTLEGIPYECIHIRIHIHSKLSIAFQPGDGTGSGDSSSSGPHGTGGAWLPGTSGWAPGDTKEWIKHIMNRKLDDDFWIFLETMDLWIMKLLVFGYEG